MRPASAPLSSRLGIETHFAQLMGPGSASGDKSTYPRNAAERRNPDVATADRGAPDSFRSWAVHRRGPCELYLWASGTPSLAITAFKILLKFRLLAELNSGFPDAKRLLIRCQ